MADKPLGAEKSGVAGSTEYGNRLDRMEWAGAFGDLGTLIPFVVAYIGMVGMDPFGILFAFGVALIICGAYYRTPMPVQPMKAAGAVAATQAAQTAVITPAAVVGAGLATGVIWLLLGMTGTARRIAAMVPRFVVVGVVLGLGVAFMLEGVKMMASGWLIATIGFMGGIPMCHGAGGMAGHVAFGARTGGATVILGVILLLLALFFSGSVQTLFSVLPKAILGVILFLTGAQLALGSCEFSKNKGERFITLVTAAFCIWNVGLGFLAGMVGAYLNKRGLLQL